MESNQEDIVARVTELKAGLEALQGRSEEYNTQLLLNQERLEKLPALQRLHTWADEQRERFQGSDYGSTLVEVSTLTSGCVVGGTRVAPGCTSCTWAYRG